jgi:tetratricopeptide (TPR) repeat protein
MKANPRAAIREYGMIAEEYPLTEPARVALEEKARLEHKEGDAESAIEDLSALLKLYPESSDRFRYRVLLSNVYMSIDKFSQARVELSPLLSDAGVKEVPPDVLEQAVFTYAESLFLEDRREEAINWYQAFIENFPRSKVLDEAKLHLATCLEELGHLGAAKNLTSSAGNYPNKKVVDARLDSINKRGQSAPSEEKQSKER